MTLDQTTDDSPRPRQPVLDCWYLTGPTASGKTLVGLELAQRLNAEIISLDSMTVYREMDIGTAKPSLADRARVPHHLLDLVEPDADFSVANYVDAAHDAIRDIRRRGKEVLFVGGTPLYLKSLLRGIFQGPPADWEFREEVEREIESAGIAALHQRLEQVDPVTAARLHPNDKRRIIRALEVNKLTGRPISHQQTQFDEGSPSSACRVFVLEWPRPLLHERIAARVQQMFAQGLVEEVRQILAKYSTLSRTASQAVGYREVIEHLRGEHDLATTIERVTFRTRQFARRQGTWFRSLSECRPVPDLTTLSPAEVAERILEMNRASVGG